MARRPKSRYGTSDPCDNGPQGGVRNGRTRSRLRRRHRRRRRLRIGACGRNQAGDGARRVHRRRRSGGARPRQTLCARSRSPTGRAACLTVSAPGKLSNPRRNRSCRWRSWTAACATPSVCPISISRRRVRHRLVIVMIDVRRRGLLERLTWPRWTPEIHKFLWMLGPAIGISASYQIGRPRRPDCRLALTYRRPLGHQLRRPALSVAGGRHRYRHRLGAAQGNVGPRRPRRHPGGNRRSEPRRFADAGARRSLHRRLSSIPDLIVAVAFEHGAFKANATQQAAGVLAAYAIGMRRLCWLIQLPRRAFCRAATGDAAQGHAGRRRRQCGAQDRAVRLLGAPGLALATAAGLWIKVACVAALARLRRGWTAPDPRLLADRRGDTVCGRRARAGADCVRRTARRDDGASPALRSRGAICGSDVGWRRSLFSRADPRALAHPSDALGARAAGATRV